MAVAVRLFFWAYTGRTWEDALIVLTHAASLARGEGLTHPSGAGVMVQGFTSPLGALIPAFGECLWTGSGLALLRLVSAMAGGLSVLFALGLAIHSKVRLPLPLAIVFMAYVGFEHGQVLWGMSGMETQTATLALLASAYYLLSWRPYRLGACLGLCMLCRPDFAFWAAIVGVFVLIRDWRALPKVVGPACLLYLPWIVFAWAYYGDPVPHTIHAKALLGGHWWLESGLGVRGFLRGLWQGATGSYTLRSVVQPLGPAFAGHGTGYAPVIPDGGLVASTVSALAAVGLGFVALRHRALACVAAFAVVYGAYYLFLVGFPYAWYLAPFCVMLLLLALFALARMTEAVPYPHLRPWLSRGFAAAYLTLLLGILPFTFHTEAKIQRIVEDGVRRPLGQWLRETPPDTTIGCEALGYVGYYAQRRVYDWPGLANPEVVAYARNHPEGRSYEAMLRHFKPDYLVLRMRGDRFLEVHPDWVHEDYAQVRRFTAPPEALAHLFEARYNIDTDFAVFKRRDLASFDTED